MARDFGAGAGVLGNSSLGNEFDLTAGSTIQAITCWILFDSMGSSQFSEGIFYLGEGDGWGVTQSWSAGEVFGLIVYTQGQNTGAITGPPSFSTGTWYHVYALFDQANDTVKVYADGISCYDNSSYTNTSTSSAPSITWGSNDSDSDRLNGEMAEMALLGGAGASLSDAQITALAKGYSPLIVCPGAIIDYWDGIRTNNGRLGTNLTASGTVVTSPHPPIIYPSPPTIMHSASADDTALSVTISPDGNFVQVV